MSSQINKVGCLSTSVWVTECGSPVSKRSNIFVFRCFDVTIAHSEEYIAINFVLRLFQRRPFDNVDSP